MNEAPTVALALVDQTGEVGTAFSYAFAAGSFADLDAGQSLSYGATLSDGSALPAWLSFNPATRTFSGTPAVGDIATITIRVTATDDATPGLSVTDDFTLAVGDTTAPAITGPSGGAGALASATSVAENQTAVTQMTASESVTWTISGGADAALFQIATDGTITFVSAPDYEAPGDANTDNDHVLILTATDPSSNAASQTLTVSVTDVNDSLPGEVRPTMTDVDGDMIDDGLESMTADRDGDGIVDAQDYDPAGYFYCEEDGRILSGAAISVSGPAGSNSSIGVRNNINIVKDGSTGEYQWFATAPGTYTMAVTYPAGVGVPSTTVTSGGTLDVTTLLPNNPASIGSSEFGSSGYIADPSAAANPVYYLLFDIAAGDPNVIGNNIPMAQCGSNAISVTSVTSGMEPVNGTSSSLSFTVSMARAAVVDTVLSYTVSGTAMAGADYTAPSGNVTIVAGATSATIDVPVLADADVEGAETVVVTLDAITAGDPTTILAAAPGNRGEATISDGPLQSIETDLRDILADDMAQTIEAQQDRFDRIAKGALGRLQAGQDSVACGTIKDGDVSGSIEVSGGNGTATGTFGQDVNDCNLGQRRITEGSFTVTTTDGAGTSAAMDVAYLRERFVSKDDLRGRFFGGYLRSSQVDAATADGTILGFGVNLGTYGARRLSGDLFLDYYAAAAAGYHTFDLAFKGRDITATGHYAYGAIFGGAAVSGQVDMGDLKIRPRAGVELAFGQAAHASVLAQSATLTERGQISLPDYEGGNVFAEFTIGKTIQLDALGLLTAQLDVTPRLVCDLFGPETGCAFEGAVEFRQWSEATGVNLIAGVEVIREQGRNTLRLNLERERIIDGGRTTTGIVLDAQQNLLLQHKLEMEF